MDKGHVLVVDDEPEMLENCRRLLAHEGHACTTLGESRRFLEVLHEARPDVILCDLRMPEVDGMELLATARAEDPELPVILITGYATVNSAVEAIQEGAFDYLAKPFTPRQLGAAVTRALRQRRLTQENRRLRDQAREKDRVEILGESAVIERVKDQIRKAAPTEANVLIWGESGTGKELVARSLHHNSSRAGGPFVAVDCATIPGTLLESSLFGHEKGAFTGAIARQRGLLEQAHRGTLFLDEITQLGPVLQSRLLRALQEREMRRVGGSGIIALDIRVIAATNLNPTVAVAEGLLREDLYYRLHVVPIAVPPLRDRDSDILLLFQTFLRRSAESYGKTVPRVSRAAWDAIERYPWPGNVRELKNVAERLIIFDDDGAIGLGDLPEALRRKGVVVDERWLTSLEEPYAVVRERALRAIEGRYAEQVVDRYGGNVTAAARAAGVSRRTLHRWLRNRRTGPEEEER